MTFAEFVSLAPPERPALELQIWQEGPVWQARLNGRQVHSRQPLREAENLVKSLLAANPEVVLIFGCGLGYVARALLDSNPEITVFMVEPDLRIASTIAAAIPDQPLWRDPRIEWFPIDQLDLAVRQIQTRQVKRLARHLTPAIVQAFNAEAETFRSAVDEFEFRRDVNIRTLQRFGELWVRNLLRNYRELATAGVVDAVLGRFGGIPVLVVAGGPSLDSLNGSWAALRDRCLLVAVDTSLRACLQAGIDPDFVVSADPQYWNTRHLDGCRRSHAIFVSEPAVYARSLRCISGPVVLSGSLFPLGGHLERSMQTRSKLGAGGSVATTAWDFARQLTDQAVYLAGLDLSFPRGQTHFHGSFFEEATHLGSHRLKPAAHDRFAYLHDGFAYLCEAEGGGFVYSDRRMDIYAHWFEQQVQLHPYPPTLRLTAPHRKLRGLPGIDVATLLEKPVIRAELNARLEAIRRTIDLGQAERANRSARMRTIIGDLDGALERLSTTVESALAACGRLLNGAADTHQELDLLSEIDEAIAGSENQRIVGFLLEDSLQEIQRLAPPRDFAESIHRSQTLYERLRDSIAIHRRLARRYVLDLPG